MSGKATRKIFFGGILMCNFGFGGNNCWWIIILILLFCCCGNGNGNACGCGNNNACGNGCGNYVSSCGC